MKKSCNSIAGFVLSRCNGCMRSKVDSHDRGKQITVSKVLHPAKAQKPHRSLCDCALDSSSIEKLYHDIIRSQTHKQSALMSVRFFSTSESQLISNHLFQRQNHFEYRLLQIHPEDRTNQAWISIFMGRGFLYLWKDIYFGGFLQLGLASP